MNSAERNRLITENMPLVTAIAADYRGRGVDFEDLIGVGRVGLTEAADSFLSSAGTFSAWASIKINSAIGDALKSGRYHPAGDKSLDWGDEHAERISEWDSWGDSGNARAIYEMWPEGFDASPEVLTEIFDDIRDKQEKFNAAFISLKPVQRKMVTLVYLRDPPLSIERASRELRISYLKGWRTLKRSLQTMRNVISAMESKKKPLILAA